jgi:hypothetical protein
MALRITRQKAGLAATKRPFINDSNGRSSVELSPVGYTLATCEAI